MSEPLYKFYIDGELLENEPKGWRELVTSINEVENPNGLFITQEVVLTFYGPDYTRLKALFDDSFCEFANIEIFERRGFNYYISIHKGLMFVTEFEIFPDKKLLNAKVQDNSYYAKIKKNSSVETYIEVGKSLNKVDINGATATPFECFDVCNPSTWTGRFVYGYRLYEVFRTLIEFMSDGEMEFDSSLLGVGGELEFAVLTSCKKLASTDPGVYGAGSTYIGKVSFNEAFSELYKTRKVGMMIDNTGVKPKLIIELEAFFKKPEVILTLENVSAVKLKIDTDKLISQINLGSSTTLATGLCPDPPFPEEIDFRGFKDEKFWLLGKCNVDKMLELVRTWVVSSNVIQDCVNNNNDQYDDEKALVMCFEYTPGVFRALPGNPFAFLSVNPRYFNEALTNDKVAFSFLRSLPNSIATFLGDGNDAFKASCYTTVWDHVFNASDPSVSAIVPYTNDFSLGNFDPNNNWDISTAKYTAPLTGLYGFKITQAINVYFYNYDFINNADYGWVNVTISLKLYDSTNALKTTYSAPTNKMYGIQKKVLVADFPGFVMITGDYIKVELSGYFFDIANVMASPIIIRAEVGTIESTVDATGGGEYQTHDPEKFPAYRIEFKHMLNPDQMDLIKANPDKAIAITTVDDEKYKFHIKNLKYQHLSGQVDIIGSTSKELNESP
jgi:hypothetical protein